MVQTRTKHQGDKYTANKGKETSKKITDGFSEWRYKATGEAIPEAFLSSVPNGDKIKISYIRKVVSLKYPRPHDFVYFDVKRFSTSGTEFIGRVTEYTNEDRLASLIYRYLHPDHAKSCIIEGKVLYSGGAEGSGVSRMPYIEVPDTIEEASDLRVDDEVRYTVSSMGCSYTANYHMSQMGVYHGLDGGTRRLILPLTQIKRLVIYETEDKDEEGRPRTSFKFVSKKIYDKHTLQLMAGEPLTFTRTRKPRKSKANPNPKPIIEEIPCRRFIDEYTGVTVEIVPEDTTVNDWAGARMGRFDFACETIKKLSGRASGGDCDD